MTITIQTHWIKYIVGWGTVFLFRLIPLRIPNVEPLLATLMPFSKRYGPLSNVIFAVSSIALYDAVTSGWGMWTLVTSVAYGALALGSYYYFSRRAPSVRNFLTFGVLGTLFYDVVTGLTVGPLFFNQPLMGAVIGQIPFTLLHLAGTIVFATCLSPAIYGWIMQSKAVQISLPWPRLQKFKPVH